MTADYALPEVGSLWHRKGGREVVRVERVWFYKGGPPEDHGWAIRSHPTHGGTPTIWWPADFHAHYEAQP